MAHDVFIVAIDLGGFTVPALLTYSDERWRVGRDERDQAPPAGDLAPPEPVGLGS